MTNFKVIFCLSALILAVTNADSTPSDPFTLIDLNKNPTFTVKVESKDSTPENPLSVESSMQIAIDNSQSVLFKTCNLFDTSKFSSFKVNPEENNKEEDQYNVTYNLLNVRGYSAQAKVTIDEKYWSTNSLTVINKCGDDSREYKETQGIIGLGYKGDDAKKNFKGDTKSFALYGSKSKTVQGNLVFNPAAADVQKHTLLKSLKADENWHVSGPVKVTVAGREQSMDNLDVTFDMRSPFNIFPWDLFQHVMNKLYPLGVSYDWLTFRGNWSALPDVVINAGGQDIVLKPDQYITMPLSTPKKNYETQKVTFLIGSHPANKDRVTLGWRYMYDHYTVFDMNDGHIKFYTADESIEKDKATRQQQTKDAEENYRKEVERKRKEKEDEEREAREAKEKKEKEEEESARRKKIIGWTVGIVIFLIIVGVAGFFGWKKYQAKRLASNNEGNQALMFYGQTQN